MSYEEALKVAEENAKGFKTWNEDGNEFIEVNGKKFPKQWFIRTCARMKTNGEV